MYDLVEWAAAQPWCDGNVGMIGISYFAMTQLEAAVERPPHLKAIFPLAVTADLYEGAVHHGLLSSGFVTPFLSMIGLTSDRSDEFWRSLPVQLARKVLHAPPLHRKFATMNGEASLVVMRQLLKLPHDPHPWDDLWLNAAVKHPLARRVVGRAGSHPTAGSNRHSGIPRLRLGERSAASAVNVSRVEGIGGQPECAHGHARPLRTDLAVGEPAHGSSRLVRPLAEGPGHRYRRWRPGALRAAGLRRMALCRVMASAWDASRTCTARRRHAGR